MDQTSQENAHYQRSSIGPNKGTKVGHILFMKNHLINHQSLNFNTIFQGLDHKWLCLETCLEFKL